MYGASAAVGDGGRGKRPCGKKEGNNHDRGNFGENGHGMSFYSWLEAFIMRASGLSIKRLRKMRNMRRKNYVPKKAPGASLWEWQVKIRGHYAQ